MIYIRKYQHKDLLDVARLVRQTFSKYNPDEGTPSAIQAYIDRFDPKKIGLDQVQHRLESTKIFYVAEENKKVVGMVRGIKGRLVNLFIDGKFHRNGIGKQLMQKFEAKAFDERNAINVKSSIFAVPFYTSIGYKKTTGIRNLRGLSVQPMKKAKQTS